MGFPSWVPWLALPLIALGAILLISRDETQTQTERVVLPARLGLESIELDGCEYWYGRNGGIDSAVLTHKGNCKNPIHIYNNEAN